MNIKSLFILASFFILSSCSASNSIIESYSTPESLKFVNNPAEIPFEEVSKHTTFEDMKLLKVIIAKINGKGPFKIGVLLENDTLDPEFITGLIYLKTLEAMNEKLRYGKIHHAIKTMELNGLVLNNFLVEVYTPQPSEMNNPITELDGVLTAGMLKNADVYVDFARSLFIVKER